jgi:hypothetical protein
MSAKDTLEPNESLELIERFIRRNKEDFRDQSFYFLLWGWLVAICCLVYFFLMQYSSLTNAWIVWPVTMSLGVIGTLWYVYTYERKKEVETHSDGFLKHLWMVVGFSFIPMIFLNVIQKDSPVGYIMLLAAIGTMITGLTIRFKPLIWGGVVFFLAAIVAPFITPLNGLILNAVALILGYIIPATLLKKKG